MLPFRPEGLQRVSSPSSHDLVSLTRFFLSPSSLAGRRGGGAPTFTTVALPESVSRRAVPDVTQARLVELWSDTFTAELPGGPISHAVARALTGVRKVMMDPVGEADHHSKINSSELNLKMYKNFSTLGRIRKSVFRDTVEPGRRSLIHSLTKRLHGGQVNDSGPDGNQGQGCISEDPRESRGSAWDSRISAHLTQKIALPTCNQCLGDSRFQTLRLGVKCRLLSSCVGKECQDIRSS